MLRHLILLSTLCTAISCGGEVYDTIPGTLTPVIHVPEQALTWSKCLVGQTHQEDECIGQPRRLALCANDTCQESPATDACHKLGAGWRLPTFFEYERLRYLWPVYEDHFDFPEVRTAILTNTAHQDSQELAVAYQLNPYDPELSPWILFSKTAGAWVHCVSVAHTVF